MTIVITIIILGILVLAHEWGHFIVARKIGIPVHEFSIGFGYKVFSTRRNGVEYSLRLLPLGGFVRMAGEEPGDQQDPRGYSKRRPVEKMMVSFAGPFMNFVLAVLIFIYSFAFIGIPEASNQPVVGKVLAGEPADLAGLEAGDRILAINEQAVTSWDEVTAKLAATPEGEKVTLEIQRKGEELNISVMPEKNPSTGVPVIGIRSVINYEKQGIIKSIGFGIQQTYELTVVLLGGLWMMITGGVSPGEIAGPVGITMLVGEAAQVGTVFLLSFMAFLSINLGILNLLPIPALDGSRIVFAAVEAIRRRPIEPEREGFIHWLGFLFLMFLIVLVTYNDILRLVKGWTHG